ncbi:NYN domain-containing protein [Massilia sp. TS11]|uniref:NYN domain-containing protein n=1 Tax=Massilia sp. TS11 TaxID=2908003 RepID=UPI001EDC0FB3|nr:NYN domain-containing protein [Massilia sp. TS11]MCG2583268.1 NYN domain-containing protein [Massilia sp. TS11]
MASSHDNLSMAVFCDFENVALGVRDANYEKFDIKPVLERLLLKGSIVVKKAYCDWDRYKGFKAPMHEANFELIEIPHVRQSGKNSADIRLVVDALDLCYTKSHVNTFVIVSGDSDFSPLVSKLRENAKIVIGVGVKQSTSDLLVSNCDEFIFYDDLVRGREGAKRDQRQSTAKRTPEEEKRRKDEMEARRSQAIYLAVQTFEAMIAERGDSGKIWASLLKDAIKRRKPDFSESYCGFRTFGNLLEEAQHRGMLEVGRDEKSGAYVYRSSGAARIEPPQAEAMAAEGLPAEDLNQTPETVEAAQADDAALLAEAPARAFKQHEPRRKARGGQRQGKQPTAATEAVEAESETVPEAAVAEAPVADSADVPAKGRSRRGRGGRGRDSAKPAKEEGAPVAAVAEAPAPAPVADVPAEAKPKAARAPRKPKAAVAEGDAGEAAAKPRSRARKPKAAAE